MDRAIHIEFITKHVVIISNSRNSPYDESDVLGNADIRGRRVTLDGIAGVEFKHTDTAGVGMGGFSSVIGGVEIGGICGTVKAIDELKLELTEPVLAVEISIRGLERVGCRRVMSYGFLQPKFIDNPFSFVPDFVQMHTKVSAAGEVKTKIHFHRCQLCNHFETSFF